MEHMRVHWYVSKDLTTFRCLESRPSVLQTLLIAPKYTAAVKTSALESTSRALTSLSEVLKKDAKLPAILSAPSLTSEDKSQIVQELQKHTGGADKGDTVKNFLQTLADNNRLGILGSVCEKFTDLMGAAKGELDMIVTSAAVMLLFSIRLDVKKLILTFAKTAT